MLAERWSGDLQVRIRQWGAAMAGAGLFLFGSGATAAVYTVTYAGTIESGFDSFVVVGMQGVFGINGDMAG